MQEKQKFNVIVLGGGVGGYVAAIRARQRGASVALIEAHQLGGTCLNVGCIPTKALIANAEVYRKILRAQEYGISVGQVALNFAKMTQRKDEVVTGIRKNLEGLIRSDEITLFKGYGRLTSSNEITVLGKEGALLQADKIIIATGSEPKNIPAFPFDGKRIHSSSTILDLVELPKKLAIVGGGVIGCEAASLYRALGVEVVILELLPRLISTEGKDLSMALTKAFEKQGIEVVTEVLVEGIDTSSSGVTLRLKDREAIQAEMALVAIGRQLNTTDIGLDKAGVATTAQGAVIVNEHMQTNVPNVYAVGDITAKWMLAHVASHQGIVAANNATGLPSRMHYNAIPSVIFTHPEIASVGMTLEKAKEEGFDAVEGSFPFSVLGKAVASLETEGFARVIIDRSTKEILGAQVMGHEATALIAQMTQAISNELIVESIEETIHAHPTLSEAWLEATLLADGRAIHLPQRKKR